MDEFYNNISVSSRSSSVSVYEDAQSTYHSPVDLKINGVPLAEVTEVADTILSPPICKSPVNYQNLETPPGTVHSDPDTPTSAPLLSESLNISKTEESDRRSPTQKRLSRPELLISIPNSPKMTKATPIQGPLANDNLSTDFVTIALDDDVVVKEQVELANTHDRKWNAWPKRLFQAETVSVVTPIDGAVGEHSEVKQQGPIEEDVKNELLEVEMLLEESAPKSTPQENMVSRRPSAGNFNMSDNFLLSLTMSELESERNRLLGRIQTLSTALVDHLESREIIAMQNAQVKQYIAKLLDKLGRNGNYHHAPRRNATNNFNLRPSDSKKL